MKKIAKKRHRRLSDKPKKVTLKFFLNKAVQPLVDGKEKRYPLYVLITYNRKNTMIRCKHGNYYKDFKEIDKVHYPGLLAFEERIIRKTISMEQTLQGAEFDMKGLHRKYEQYSKGIHEVLGQFLKNGLWNVLLRLEPYEYAKALNFNDPDVDFETLLAITKRIYKNLNDLLPRDFETQLEIYQTFNKLYRGAIFDYTFPTIIEWTDKTAMDDYNTKLESVYKNDQQMIRRSIVFIDKVIRG